MPTGEGVNWDDGKEPGALRTIGEISRALSIKPHILRYWEEKFSVLRPLKRRGGRRYYRPADVEMVMRINDLLNAQGYTIEGANKALSGITGSAIAQQEEPVGTAVPRLDLPTTTGIGATPSSVADTDRSQVQITELKTRLVAIRQALSAAIADPK